MLLTTRELLEERRQFAALCGGSDHHYSEAFEALRRVDHLWMGYTRDDASHIALEASKDPSFGLNMFTLLLNHYGRAEKEEFSTILSLATVVYCSLHADPSLQEKCIAQVKQQRAEHTEDARWDTLLVASHALGCTEPRVYALGYHGAIGGLVNTLADLGSIVVDIEFGGMSPEMQSLLLNGTNTKYNPLGIRFYTPAPQASEAHYIAAGLAGFASANSDNLHCCLKELKRKVRFCSSKNDPETSAFGLAAGYRQIAGIGAFQRSEVIHSLIEIGSEGTLPKDWSDARLINSCAIILSRVAVIDPRANESVTEQLQEMVCNPDYDKRPAIVALYAGFARREQFRIEKAARFFLQLIQDPGASTQDIVLYGSALERLFSTKEPTVSKGKNKFVSSIQVDEFLESVSGEHFAHSTNKKRDAMLDVALTLVSGMTSKNDFSFAFSRICDGYQNFKSAERHKVILWYDKVLTERPEDVSEGLIKFISDTRLTENALMEGLRFFKSSALCHTLTQSDLWRVLVALDDRTYLVSPANRTQVEKTLRPFRERLYGALPG